jgi:hypothetical protein
MPIKHFLLEPADLFSFSFYPPRFFFHLSEDVINSAIMVNQVITVRLTIDAQKGEIHAEPGIEIDSEGSRKRSTDI